MSSDHTVIRERLEALVPARTEAEPDWTGVLERAIDKAPAAETSFFGRKRRLAFALAFVALALAAPLIAVGATQNWWLSSNGGVVPEPVFLPVHGRPAGWARAGSYWFVVYVKGGRGCGGLNGGTWRMALVETTQLPERVVADRRIGGAMCGNSLTWVKAGRFSDGRHQEVAFMLWTTPSIGAWTYLYRIDDGHLNQLAKFSGDSVKLSAGTVSVTYENRARSSHGEIEDIYRFKDGHYELVSRK